MKVIGLIFLCIASCTALPAASRSPVEPDDCSKECLKGVIKFGQELSILKHPDLSNYFKQIDDVCEVITTARKCLEKCGHSGASKNPFSLDSLNIVCQPKTQEKIASIKQCLKYVDTNINEICSKECNDAHTIDENDTKMDATVQAANKNCQNFKCMARCNIEVTAEQCGKEIGSEFESLLQEVVDTQRKDLESLNLVEAMSKSSPPECSYLYDPSVLFGEKPVDDETSSSPSVDPKEDAKSLFAQAQLQLLLKQLELTEKQDQLIEKENAKLDMEMSFLTHKAEKAERKFFAQHALPTFVPLNKMPKEPMAMEAISGHPEQMESQQQPSMEPSAPMNFPHPMPLETVPQQPKMPKMPKFGPVMINGMPMEFVPMGFAPEMPMEPHFQ